MEVETAAATSRARSQQRCPSHRARRGSPFTAGASIGPDFISLQARDLDKSQAFYEQYLGLVRSQTGPPHAVVFETKPIAFALRDIVPGTDLASVAQPGIGAAIWFHATDVQAIHDALVADGHTIVSAPIDGPFGRTFTFADPDGYHGTLHDRA